MKSLAVVAASAINDAGPLRVPDAQKATSAPPPKPVPVIEDSIEPSVYRFILRHSLKQQIMLLVFTLVSFPFLYYSLELPKTIVNRAIGGKRFPQEFLAAASCRVAWPCF